MLTPRRALFVLALCLGCAEETASPPRSVEGTGGAAGASSGSGGTSGSGGALPQGGMSVVPPFTSSGAQPFPRDPVVSRCLLPTQTSPEAILAAYETFRTVVLTPEGANGYLRVWKPDSGTVLGSTVSEGIGYGMLLAVYFGDQPVFDALFGYAAQYLNANGLMDWEVDPNGRVIGRGAATDGDEDIAFALLMAERQWGGQGALGRPYLELATTMIEAILTYEVAHTRDSMLLPGDAWGDVDITNPSYFAPAYFRVFGEVTGKQAEWAQVIDENYAILERSLNAASGNAENGLVPAWCNQNGEPVVAYAGAPTHFQNDSTRTPFRVGQDYCWFGEARALSYLGKLASFYASQGVANIVDGYELDGTPRPERAVDGLQAASFLGPAGVAFSAFSQYQGELDEVWSRVASQGATAGTIYYQKSWTALSLLMLGGHFSVFPARE